MPSYTTFNIRMQRESPSIPWGFRMQGGKDTASPLQIQRVNPNSLAERYGILNNDYILRIGQVSTEYLDHQSAQEQIKRYSNVLELTLQRGAPPSNADYNSRLNSSAQIPFYPEPTAAAVRPVPQPQVIMPISNEKVMLNQSFNTPIGLYSTENIDDTIARTLKSINMGSNNRTGESRNNLNEFKVTESKSMPKPSPAFTPPTPYTVPPPSPVQPPKPTGPPKGLFLGNKPGNRSAQKGARGSALLNQNDNVNQVATCHACGTRIRGPFITAINRCYCVNHFTCSHCSTDLVDCGFIEENDKLYCEKDFEDLLAPNCEKCSQKILKECVHALEKNWHPQCFLCTACNKPIGSGSFHVEEGQPYCQEDYRRMFQAKCTGCEFPIEPGDKYLEAMGGTYHAECFTCSTCQVSLDGQGFVVKNNRPYCRQHATRQALSTFQ